MSNVLLVEPHALVRAGLSLMLKSGGWEQVGEAENASQAQALALLEQLPVGRIRAVEDEGGVNADE